MGILLALAGFMMLALLTAGLTAWAWALVQLRRGVPLVHWEPRRPVPWGLIDVVIAIVLLFALQIGAMLVLRGAGVIQPGDADALTLRQQELLLVIDAVTKLLAFTMTVLLISFRTRATRADFGFRGEKFLADARLGVVAFVMLAPPVYLIQLVLVQFWPVQHPLIELLKVNPDPLFFAITGVSAVLIAPVVEEYLFRGLLQGWLESLRRWMTWEQIVLGVQTPSGENKPPINVDDAPPVIAKVVAPSENPYVTPAILEDPPLLAMLPEAGARPAVWPIFVSALLFAAAHYSHGPAPIPLFFLALGLGYLYQRTHRIVPCIVVHFLLNLWSMLLLLIQISIESAAR